MGPRDPPPAPHPPRRLHVVEAGRGWRSDGPVLRGSGDPGQGRRDSVCGQCFQPLCERVDPERLDGLIIACPRCGALNATRRP